MTATLCVHLRMPLLCLMMWLWLVSHPLCQWEALFLPLCEWFLFQ